MLSAFVWGNQQLVWLLSQRPMRKCRDVITHTLFVICIPGQSIIWFGDDTRSGYREKNVAVERGTPDLSVGFWFSSRFSL